MWVVLGRDVNFSYVLSYLYIFTYCGFMCWFIYLNICDAVPYINRIGRGYFE